MANSGRKPTPPTAPVATNLAHEVLEADNAALTVLGQRSREVAERFGDGLPYERERLVTETRFLMSQSAEAMLEAGKRLIQIKENEPFGDFISIVESRLGLGKRTAQVMMTAAFRYLSPALASKAKTLALLGKSKILDLMVEDDSALSELAEGGTIAGLKLDDMQAMSVRELRAALAEARQTLDARAKLLAKANEKADRLKERLAKPYIPTDADIAKTAEENALLSGIADACTRAQAALQDLAIIAADLDNSSAANAVRSAAHTNVEYLAQRLAQLIQTHGIPVQFENEVVPSWVTTAKAKAKANKHA